MKYKVGDRVRIKSLDWYNKNKDNNREIKFENGIFTILKSTFLGQIMTIEEITPEKQYILMEDKYKTLWTDEMIEGLVEEEEIEFTEEDKYWCDIMSESDPTTYVLPEGYQFVDENGNVINATKIVLEKKKKEYPQTYEECCKVMNYCCNPVATKTTHKEELIRRFQFLLLYRDAYWKIAGEEMGLGKPWEPSKDKMVYNIYRHSNKIETDIFSGESVTFEFPTREMRDAFFENFNKDIEICKEFL